MATRNTQGANISEDNINEIAEGLAENDIQLRLLQEVRGRPGRTPWLYKDWAVLTNDYRNTGSGAWPSVTAIRKELFNSCVATSSGTQWASFACRPRALGLSASPVCFVANIEVGCIRDPVA